jgi:prepilin-type N-terminal cleavage/methylation domain-containing protein
MNTTKTSKGFSLIELLIVVAIILIIAAIAIPNLLRARISANEASAVASIRAINTAELAYQTSYPNAGYAPALANLGGGNPCTPSPTTACLLDNNLANGTKSGYNFTAQGGSPVNGANTSYVAGAAPTSYNQSGVRLFCSIEDNVVRWDANTSKSTTPPNAQQCPNFTPLQ